MWHFIFVIIGLLGHIMGASAQQDMQSGLLNVLSFEEAELYGGAELYRQTPERFREHPEFGRLPFDAQCADCYELVQERTIDSRLFYKKGTDGNVFYKQQAYGPIHFKDDADRWRTIDHRLKPVAGILDRYEAHQQPIPVTIDLHNGYTEMKLPDGGSFRFNDRTTCFVLNDEGEEVLNFGNISNPVHTAGNDGVIQYNAWPGIDRQFFVHRGEIKTGYVLEEKLSVLPKDGWLVFEENLTYDSEAMLERVTGGIPLQDDLWFGSYELWKAGKRLVRMEEPSLYDANPNPEPLAGWPICYQLREENGITKLRLLVDLEYLQSPSRVYPVVIDPIVLGVDSFNTGAMGFKFDPVCFDMSNYCDYQMTVIVPGKSTVTSAWFDAEYYSKINGCGPNSLCDKDEAGFAMTGPCGISPNANTPWSCQNSILSTIPGLCYGDSIAQSFRHLVLCSAVPPSCPDHVLDFEMRTMQCECNRTGCDTVCHAMRIGSWKITVEARTLEGYVLKDDVICPGDSVEIEAFGQWGVPPYTYEWQPGGKTDSVIKEAPVSNTTYYCTITDQCGVTVVDSARITIRDDPNVSLSKTDARCSGGSDGSATAVASGTQGPYQYDWNSDPPQSDTQASGLSPGFYTVTATDVYGCTVIDSIEVGYENFMETQATITDASCFGFADGSISLAPQGASPFDFQWRDTTAGANHTGLSAGVYHVTITDAIGCVDSLSITVAEPDSLEVDAGQDQTIIKGQVAQLDGSVMPPGTYAYEWRPPGTLLTPFALSTDATPDSTTRYVIRVTRTSNPDCWQEDSMTVFVLPQTNLYVPSAFSPNGDGHNDIFRPKGDSELRSIQVFNRWGVLMYEGLAGWDGTFNGEPQPIGTYIYVIRISDPLAEEPTQIQGNVTLLR